MVKSPQAVAQQKLDQARAQVTKKTRALKRLATSLRFWENRCRYFAARASLTDMELAVEKQKRAEQTARRRAERVRRGINLKEVV